LASKKRGSAKTTKPRRTGGARATIARAPALNFAALVHSIADVHERLVAEATKAVNVSLTLRNWLIGCYIRKYELKLTSEECADLKSQSVTSSSGHGGRRKRPWAFGYASWEEKK
jgi:hypothetical protein